MKPPTILQFNTWPDQDKVWWIDFETDGKFTNYKKSESYFPFILYEKENLGIVYQVNNAAQITEDVAMTIKEALDRLSRFHAASTAMTKTMAN